MKKLTLFIFELVLACVLGSSAYALQFTFSGSDAGGTGSALMDIVVDGNTVEVSLDNISPLTLDDGTGVNAPGITGFGFQLDPDTLNLLTWTLTDRDGEDLSKEWKLSEDNRWHGILIDYIPHVDHGISGALYNPMVTEGQAALPNYYTTAILTLEFNDMPILNTEDYYSPFVRMQNVGQGGAGSLKLSGEPVPEPATILLIGTGLLGLVGFRKKFKK